MSETDLDDSTGSEVEVGNNYVINENVIYENLQPIENTTDENDTDSDFQLYDESVSTTSESDSDKVKKRNRKVSVKAQNIHMLRKILKDYHEIKSEIQKVGYVRETKEDVLMDRNTNLAAVKGYFVNVQKK